jgi:hypothetical protein
MLMDRRGAMLDVPHGGRLTAGRDPRGVAVDESRIVGTDAEPEGPPAQEEAQFEDDTMDDLDVATDDAMIGVKGGDRGDCGAKPPISE